LFAHRSYSNKSSGLQSSTRQNFAIVLNVGEYLFDNRLLICGGENPTSFPTAALDICPCSILILSNLFADNFIDIIGNFFFPFLNMVINKTKKINLFVNIEKGRGDRFPSPFFVFNIYG
jgi:hypothetical protein